ncbi:unnamed protein product [Rhizophagus irregularis]|nr:unnamed protein product [Rhizophagus irregularis]
MKELNLDEKFNDDTVYWHLLKEQSLPAKDNYYSSNSIKRSGKINPPIVIRPGDIIFGNLNGVVCIPRRLLDKVVENCKPVNTKIDARLKEK